MPDFKITQSKINALLHEMRSWEEEAPHTVEELVERFGLDGFIVKQLATAEGVSLPPHCDTDQNPPTDPNATTHNLDPEEIGSALESPDPNPDWTHEDKDTGIWRKKPTGEWERVDGSN